MVFASTVFLNFFLPVVLLVNALLPARARNLWLLVASIFFYAWGEPTYVVVMLASITLNYVFGLLVDRFRQRGKVIVALAVAFNLGALVYFKYFDFFTATLNQVLHTNIAPLKATLPVGISFYTFQALSYVIDVYRNEAPVQRNLLDLGLYVALFPQLVAGPIVRYVDVAAQIRSRVMSSPRFAEGVKRFVVGLGKKVILANTLAPVADRVFTEDITRLDTTLAWLGAGAYMLQIYYDFSGYSDMAIGLGKMLGFEFLENFDHPYEARNIRDFWRRWHISLSTWFRDYLYIPLGGNRVGPVRTYVNLVLVFLLCGIWHGANWTFVFWGLYHGGFLVLERTPVGRLLDRLPRPLQHVYALFVVLVGWVYFRADSVEGARGILHTMLTPTPMTPDTVRYYEVLGTDAFWAFVVGILLAARWYQPIVRWVPRLVRDVGREAFLAFVLALCVLRLVNLSYNPFIYFRF